MRLINTTTHALEEFFSSKVPPYVILSHTWGDHEVTFQAFQTGTTNAKITNCCAQAVKDGYQYAWIDTCCIDKTSSSELSEAINSMYRWYANSAICYTFLEDYAERLAKQNWWETTEVETQTLITQFEACRWFTRGWTLQEIIAPSCVKFFDRTWTYFGTRMSLQRALSAVTRIPLKVLTASKSPAEYNVAVRMSWAAKRQTKRLEDEAYCLMGLFDVNMPMLYGEGHRAFRRLQEEILKRHEDYSMFAWVPKGYKRDEDFLAADPSDFDEDNLKGFRFEELANITGKEFGNVSEIVLPVPSFRSRGLAIRLPFLASPQSRRTYKGWAAICSLKRDPVKLLCLAIVQNDGSSYSQIRRYDDPDQYIIPHDEPESPEFNRYIEHVTEHHLSQFVYTDMMIETSASPQSSASTAFDLRILPPSEAVMQACSIKLVKVYGPDVYDFHAYTKYTSNEEKLLLFHYVSGTSEPRIGGFVVGVRNGTPWCNIIANIWRADFYCLPEPTNHGRFMRRVKSCTDRVGSQATTRDLCRMVIGAPKYDALRYLVVRVVKVGSEPEVKWPQLQLEIALVPPLGAGFDYTEVGVLDCNLQIHSGNSIVRDIGEHDVVLSSGEEELSHGRPLNREVMWWTRTEERRAKFEVT